ncbi:MAG TPA: hypothetical protein DFI01_08900 [Bacteroidales bacterium]|nr:hypothetical protein [Bacteroidales bacterium]
MEKRPALIFISLILFTTSYSEVNDSTRYNSPQKIQDHSKALQFLLNQNFQLSQFQGSTISFKYHLSQKQAIRSGITLNGSNSEYNADHQIVENDSLNSKDLTNNDYISVSIYSQYLLYRPAKYSYIFYGLGPLIRYSLLSRYDEIQRMQTGTWNISETREQKSSSYYIGLSFVIGCEIFISKSISIHGEYNQEITYHYQYEKDILPTRVSKSRSSGFSFGNNPVKFGCSFYW